MKNLNIDDPGRSWSERKIHILLMTAISGLWKYLVRVNLSFLYWQWRPYTSAVWSLPKATYSPSLIMFSPSRMMGHFTAFRWAYLSTINQIRITWIVSWQLWFPGCDLVSLKHCWDSESTVWKTLWRSFTDLYTCWTNRIVFDQCSCLMKLFIIDSIGQAVY